jgi:hypothetical protein
MLSLERKQHKDHTRMSGSMSLCMAENKAYVIAKCKVMCPYILLCGLKLDYLLSVDHSVLYQKR